MIAAIVTTIVEAHTRIPPEFTRQGLTFFGPNDWWLFIAAGVDPCPDCKGRDGMPYNGSELRSEFTYLRITGPNTIMGMGANDRGLVHPHCQCMLTRQFEAEDHGVIDDSLR
jgi:hypothetical protein